MAEGDRVAAGDVVARIDTRDTELQIQRARAERDAADAQLRLLRAGSRGEDIRQAEAQVQASEAEAAGTDAELKAAQLDLDRFESLLQANAGSRKQRDDAQARVDLARERQRGAKDRVLAAREATARLRAGARPEEIDAARARVAGVDAQIASLQKAVGDAVVTASAAGLVTQKLAEAGELTMPRMPLVVITDLDNAWANLFVPEPMIPRVRLGQSATIFTDAGGPGCRARSPSCRRGPSSPRGTCRRRKSARSSCTESRCASTTRQASSSPGCPSMRRSRSNDGRSFGSRGWGDSPLGCAKALRHDGGAVGTHARCRARRNVRPDRAGWRRQDDSDSTDVRAAPRRRRGDPCARA